MPYNTDHLAKLAALKSLAEKIKSDYATKEEVNTLSERVNGLVTAGGEPNKIEVIKVNGTAQAITEKAVDITVPTKVGQLTNDKGYQTAADVTQSINGKLGSVYKPGGSYAFNALPEAGTDTLGMVYNVTDKFTTTADFVEGAGKAHPAGTNVVVVQVESAYKYDVLAGFVDLSGYQPKETGKGLSTNDYTNDDKEKLAGLNNYTHPASAKGGGKTAGLYKIATDANGHVSDATTVTKEDITTLGIPESDTTYEEATQSAPGLMSAEDKKKLDGMETATAEEVTEMLNEVFAAD